MIDEKKLIEERPEWLNPDCVGSEEYNKGWNACNKYWCNTIKRQPKVGEWIPCSERLPERYCHCLVTRINEYEDGFDTDVREDTYVEIEGVWDWQSNHEGLIDKVIAWQPLPKPFHPKGE